MPTRPLTAFQAANCEHALETVCQCRCGGALHGARRRGLAFDPAAYYQLPPDDPHYAEPRLGAYQLPLFPASTDGGECCLRNLAADFSAVGAVPDPDLRPETRGGA
jgi:hypothetical protein